MRLTSPSEPIKRDSFVAYGALGTIDSVPIWDFALWIPFALAAAATLTIWIREPLAEWTYEILIFAAAALVSLRAKSIPRTPLSAVVALLALWGFAQLVLGATVYRNATWNAALRDTALAATAFVASYGRSPRTILKAMIWFGFVVAVVSVVSYYTSAGRVLWIFPNPYPEAWGPFLNRDNFAQFLEIALPPALWWAIRHDRQYCWIAAAILAAGLASASRAGAAILLAECAVVFAVTRAHRVAIRFLAAGLLLSAIFGTTQLILRLREPDPLRYRREMMQSAVQMIRARPLSGFGLGTFSTVYPQFATFDAGLTVEHAHNDWLEWASEGGVGFAAVWAALGVIALRDLRRRMWMLGVAAVMVHALADFPFARFGVSAWTFLLIGMREVDARKH